MRAPQGGDNNEATRRLGQRGSRWANSALVIVSLLVSLAIIEIGYRLTAGLPAFKIVNWRTDQVSSNRLGDRAVFDPILGWKLRPWTDIGGFETIDHGIRRNFNETTVRSGAVLAVGDSFTEGWEVKNEESWPAVLESSSGVPFVNAGVGGYGTDQIILRAEQLLPVAKPKILIIGFLASDILRTGHSVFGAPKPHFTLEHGELRYHPPEPLEPGGDGGLLSSLAYKLRDGLGYFAAADRLLARISPNFWYSAGSHTDYRKVDIDEVGVTCALLRRLKARTDRDGIRMMLFMQYYAGSILEEPEPPPDAQQVMACALWAGIRVVDQFAALRRLANADPTAMKDYYMRSGATYGHMSTKGNRHAASLLSFALRDWLAALPGAHRDVAVPMMPVAPTAE